MSSLSTQVPKAQLQWMAGQGHAPSQRQLAAHYRQEGDVRLAEFWEAKANGHPTTTVENYFLNK